MHVKTYFTSAHLLVHYISVKQKSKIVGWRCSWYYHTFKMCYLWILPFHFQRVLLMVV